MDAKPNRIERVVILVYDTEGGSSGYSIPRPELLEIERVRDDWHRPDIAPPSWTTTFTLTTRSGYSYIAGTPPVAPSAAELSAGDA